MVTGITTFFGEARNGMMCLFCRLSVTAAAVGAVCIACSTHPVPDAETSPVPTNQIIDSRYLNAAPETGTVSVKRDRETGSICSVRFFVDAQPIADMGSAERLVLHLPVGDHVLGAAWAPHQLCWGATSEARASVTSTVTLGFRISGQAHGAVIYPTAF